MRSKKNARARAIRRFKYKLSQVKLGYSHDILFKDESYYLYAGVDEVGVSSIAGPMVAAIVVLPNEHGIDKLPIDSKRLRPDKIQILAKEIEDVALYIQVFYVDNDLVDLWGNNKARNMLWQKCADSIRELFPNIKIIIDGRHKIFGANHKPIHNHDAIINADSTYDNVSAAAIYAKAWCDNQMIKLGQEYPQYNFAQHKGYPTSEHLENIQKHGLCPVHRKSMIDLQNGIIRRKDEELNLTLPQLQAIFIELIPIAKNHPELIDEWQRTFLRDQYKTVMLEHELPTPRQQYFIRKCRNDILKVWEKSIRGNPQK